MGDKNKKSNVRQILTNLEFSALNSIKDPFGIIDRDYNILWANRQMAGIFQYSPEQIMDGICFQMFWGVDSPCPKCPVSTAIESGKSQIMERWVDFPNGERRWGEVRYHPILSFTSEVVAVTFLIIDITARKMALEQQRKYRKFLSKKLNQAAGKYQKIYLDNGEITINVSLSARETEILRLMAEGCTNIDISKMLMISPNTVKSHVNSIFNKLGVNDRTKAAVIATRFNLIS